MVSMIDPIPLVPFYPYGSITGAVPSVPNFYWNAVSDEQRWKFLCVNLKTLADYANTIAEKYNAVIDTLNSLGLTPHGTQAIQTLSPNSTTTLTIPYPTHTGTGTPVITLAVVDSAGTNLTAVVTGKGADSFTVSVTNNSSFSASSIEVDYMCIWEAVEA